MIEVHTNNTQKEDEKKINQEKVIELLDYSFIERVLTESLPTKLVADLLPRRKPRILIVEDDIESLTLISRVFRKFNCEIHLASSVDEAYSQINENIPDIIVLDWMLNEDSGQDFIQLCEQKIERFQDMHQSFSFIKPKIITFTGVQNPKLKINSNMYFEHFDHWPKPFKYKEILNKTIDLIQHIDF